MSKQVYKADMAFCKGNVCVEWGRYAGDRVACMIVDAATGELLMKASINLPNEPIADNQFFVKTWSENEGVLAFLLTNGLVRSTGRSARTGFASAPLVEILVPHASPAGVA